MKKKTFNSDGEEKKGPLDAEMVQEDKGPKPEEYPPIAFHKLFRYSTRLDISFIFLGTCCAIATGVLQSINILIFGDLTGDIVDGNIGDTFKTFAIRNSLIGLAMLILCYLSTFFYNYSSIRQIYKIRSLYLEKALNQDIPWYDVHNSGDFASRMSDDLNKLEEGLGEKVSLFINFMAAFIACLISALVKGWELALICLISLPVTSISMIVVAVLVSKLAKKESDAYGSAGSIAEEILTSIRTVISFGGERKEIGRYEDQLKFARDNNIKRSFFSGIGFGLLWFFIYSTYALAFWYGINLVLEERNNPQEEPVYTAGNMFTVFFSVMTGSMNFGMSSPYIEAFSVARGAAAKIFGVIDNKPVINASKGNGLEPAGIKGNISFKDVHFQYPSRPDVKILQGLNLEIKPGETVALVGSSGCGKSTCVQLIQRFYDPISGEVTLDNNNLKQLDLNWLRKNIGVVGQEPILFGASIAENIRYGNMEATMEDIETAAKTANAHTFINILPQKYETLIGERGAQLSGGQKQRIAIARAIVKNPAILLLDEATSALDTASEAKVQAALDKASEERTTIIIAHRLSTIRGANKIVVIHEGQVVEEGTHDELMEKKADYYKLVTTQVSASDLNVTNKSNVEEEEEEVIYHNKKISAGKIETALSEELHVEEDAKQMSLWDVVKMNRDEWPEITVGCIASLIAGGAMPVFAVLFGEIIAVLMKKNEDEVREETNTYCIYFVVAGIVVGTSTFFLIYMFGIAGEKLTMRLRRNMFDAMLKQEMGWFDVKENGVGALCAKLSSEAAYVQGATGQRIGTIMQSLSTLGLAIGLSMYYEWKLGLVCLAFAPFILLAIFTQQRVMRGENEKYHSSLEKSTKFAVEAVGNIRTVASLSCEETFHRFYVQELKPYQRTAKINSHFRAFVLGIGRSLMFFAFAACMYYGGYLIENENMSSEKVFKVSQSLIMGTASVANALAFAPNFQKGLMAATKVIKLLNRVPKIRDRSNTKKSSWANGNLEYNKVYFSYPTRDGVPVLRGIDLSVMEGKTVALVGPSGCGKSTIIQLIERFYDPLSGTVEVDKQDIRSMPLSNLRQNLSLVSQEPNLFNRTIRENIAYGNNDAQVTDAEVQEAAKSANIHNFITSLPLGYETSLGEKGTQLSGGQKQRIAIARALIRNPKVLLLDEATSALDTESEKIVQEALDSAKMGRTCITIAHRLTTIQDADLICVVNEGKVIEMGTHTQLLNQKGLYYNLHSLQQGKR